MKSILLCLFLAVPGLLAATDDPWQSDFAAARKQAAAERKSVLLLFTGSGWSGPCIEMQREVFSRDSFLQGVASKLVLAIVDMPQDESEMPDEQLDQANTLLEAYRVDGFPTVILTDPDGRPFATTGYLDGDAMKYLSHLNTLLAQKGAFDGMIAEAADQQGLEKAKTLARALRSLDLPDHYLIDFYGDLIATMDENDPQGELPFLQTLKAARRFYQLEERIEFLLDDDKAAEALQLADKGIADPGFSTDQHQRMHFFKAVVHMEAERYDEALASLEACRKLAPASEMARSLDVLKHHIEGLKGEESDTPPEPEPAPQDDLPTETAPPAGPETE